MIAAARATERRLAPHGSWIVAATAALAWHGASGPHPFDAGELVHAGFLLGGSHAPGQPLHAIVASATSLVPLGPVPWRMVWVSAAGAALAAWLAGRIAGWLLEQLDVPRSWAARLAPDAVALATLLSPPVLRQATRVEVYGLALSLTLFSIFYLLRWGASGSGGALRAGALAGGLAAALHPPHGLAVIAVGAGIALVSRRDFFRSPRAIGWAAIACLLGLGGTLAYLPIRAAAGAPMWGDPTTAGGLVDYVTASAYRGNLGAGDGGAFAHALSGLAYVAVACGVVPLAGLPFLARSARTSRAVACALVATGASIVATWVVAIDPHVPDQAAYAGAPTALAIAAGTVGLVAGASRLGAGVPLSVAAIVLVALNLAALSAAPGAIVQDAPVLETYGGALLDTPPPRALAVVEGDFEAATWMMAQAVDGARPDAAAFIPGLATSSWHWRSLTHHPLYDGRPVRGDGETARDRYVDGGIRHAMGRVPVALGPRLVHGSGSVSGPYRLLSPPGAPSAGVLDRSLGERLAPVIADDMRVSPEGDSGTVGGIVRHMQVSRAERLAARGHTDAALAELASAMAPLPDDERALLRDARGAPIAGLPRVVDSPESFLTGPDDALRAGAAMLWAAGERERATRLLEMQLERGDRAAALELGWLRLDAGDADGATRAARAVIADAPELISEARRLADAAERSRAP